MRITLIENFRAVFYAPFYATAALGAYEAEGLDVTMRMSEAAEKTLTTLAAGAGDVSWGGPLRVMAALDKDPHGGYAAFCEVVGRDPFFLLGREPNPRFRLQDLVGKKLATVSEVPTPWICLQQDLRRVGIDPSTISRAPARTMAENAAALAAGEVDVIQVFQPYARNLVDAGAGHIWYAAANRGLTSYTTFNTTRSFIEQNPDAVLRMTRAMYRTQKWIAAHDGRDLAEAIAAYLPDIAVPALAACCNDYKALSLWNANPVMRREGLEWLRDAMLAAGHIRTRLAYEECVDMRFAEQVVREDPPSL
ncbi:MAG: ABC transporter substrate-binding protein [Betaproteobacteria bacterium]|nr:ABC transporter substrate-binding protein [Betaproteobacteria bacterium]